jgi:hypothetical protein
MELQSVTSVAQLAAEQASPWHNPGVAATRQFFLLLTDRLLPR